MYKALHPWADVDRLYVSRRNGGRGLFSISNIVRLEKRSLSLYVQKCEEPIMAKIHDFAFLTNRSSSRSAMLRAHHKHWQLKSLYGP